MNYLKYCAALYSLLFLLTNSAAQESSDIQATVATRNLFKNLSSLRHQHTLFGHQDAMAYGVGWKGITGQNDVKAVAGDSPALYGWDIGHLESDDTVNIDKVPFSGMNQFIRDGYNRGTVITISWHLHNPLTGGSAWDTTRGTVKAVLPGGSKHELFKSWLDKAAVFLNQLKDSRGRHIPVLFRPFHELTGNWFWWCKNVCTPEEFISLWRFTVLYLRENRKLHHILYVYNTAEFKNETDFLSRYPGDDVVDIVSFDQYQHKTGTTADRQVFIDDMRRQIGILCQVAARKQKIAALAETGLEAVPDKEWWTEVLWPVIRDFPLSYVLVWRNHGYMPSLKKMHYYAPYPGQVSAADFKKFAAIPYMLFEKGVRKFNIYQ